MQREPKLVSPPDGIVAISDLHAESQLARALRSIDKLPDAKILILAGDIGNYDDTSLRQVLIHAASQYKHVVFVPGNHDYYGLSGSLGVSDDLLKSLAVECGCTFLQEQTIELEGYTIAGTTLWTDVSKAPKKELEDMNDYVRITGLTDLAVAAVHQRQAKWLRDLVSDPDTCPDIIVTHHMPIRTPKLKNRFDRPETVHLYQVPGFAQEIVESAAKPISCWVFGHSHVRGAVQMDKTLLFANCLGNEYGERLYGLPTGSVPLKE